MNLLGKKFGKLKVLKLTNKRIRRYKVYECVCDCGNNIEKSHDQIVYTKNPNCGCIGNRHFKHGMKKTSEYRIWVDMKQRCQNPNNSRYKRYGGRGIKICESWNTDFMNFYNDMGPRPSKKHSLDRINNDEDYSPENCRWTTIDVQVQNSTKSKITKDDVISVKNDFKKFNGNSKEFCIIQSEKLNVSPRIIYRIIIGETWKNV